MSKLFEADDTSLVIKVGTGEKKLPSVLATSKFNEGKNDLIDEKLGIKTDNIKMAIAELARTDYNTYLAYKNKQFELIQEECRRFFIAEAKRWKTLGYSDEDALAQAEKSTIRHKAELMEWFNSMFSKKGKVQQEY